VRRYRQAVIRLRKIGYWVSADEPELPDPAAFVDAEMTDRDRYSLWNYLLSGTRAPWAMMGPSMCRLCGDVNGSGEFTDGVFLWPEGLAHYVYQHKVRLPAELLTHARNVNARNSSAELDISWWMKEMVAKA
jgi:hypothetical protein